MFRILIAVFAAMLWVAAAFAAGGPDFGRALLSRIESEGYRISSVKTTWLGRVKIDSSNNSNRRQTVYNPANNAILQDLIIPLENGTFVQKLTSFLEGDARNRRNKAKGTGNEATSAAKASSSQGGGSSGGGTGTSPSNTGSGGGDGNSGGGPGKSANSNGKSGSNNGTSGTNNGKSDNGNNGQGRGSNGDKGTKK